MQTTIDAAGRVVVPKELRDRLGISAGSRVEIREDGSGLRLDLITSDIVIEVGEHLLIGGDVDLTDDAVRDLRLGNQR